MKTTNRNLIHHSRGKSQQENLYQSVLKQKIEKDSQIKTREVGRNQMALQNSSIHNKTIPLQQPENPFDDKVALQQENLLLKKEISLLKQAIRDLNLQSINYNYQKLSNSKECNSFAESCQFSDQLKNQATYYDTDRPSSEEAITQETFQDTNKIVKNSGNHRRFNSEVQQQEANIISFAQTNNTSNNQVILTTESSDDFATSDDRVTMLVRSLLQESRSCFDICQATNFEALDVLNCLVPTSREIDELILQQEMRIIQEQRESLRESTQETRAGAEETLKKPFVIMSSTKDTPDFNNSNQNDTVRPGLQIQSPALYNANDAINRKDSYKLSTTNPTERNSQKSIQIFDPIIVEELKPNQKKKCEHSNLMKFYNQGKSSNKKQKTEDKQTQVLSDTFPKIQFDQDIQVEEIQVSDQLQRNTQNKMLSRYSSLTSQRDDYNWLIDKQGINKNGRFITQEFRKNYQSPYSMKVMRKSVSKLQSNSSIKQNIQNFQQIQMTTSKRSKSLQKQTPKSYQRINSRHQSISVEKYKSQQSTARKNLNDKFDETVNNTQFTIDHHQISLSRDLPNISVKKDQKLIDQYSQFEKSLTSSHNIPKNQFDETQNRFTLKETLAEVKKNIENVQSTHITEESEIIKGGQEPIETLQEEEEVMSSPKITLQKVPIVKHKKSASLIESNFNKCVKQHKPISQQLTRKSRQSASKQRPDCTISQSLLEPVLKGKQSSRKPSMNDLKQFVDKRAPSPLLGPCQVTYSTEKTFDHTNSRQLTTNMSPRQNNQLNYYSQSSNNNGMRRNSQNLRTSQTRSSITQFKKEDKRNQKMLINYQEIYKKSMIQKHCKNCSLLLSRGLPSYLCKFNHN